MNIVDSTGRPFTPPVMSAITKSALAIAMNTFALAERENNDFEGARKITELRRSCGAVDQLKTTVSIRRPARFEK